MGETGGVETVTLSSQQIPVHTHAMTATDDLPSAANPADNVIGQGAAKFFRAGNPMVQLSPQTVGVTGGSQPHENMQPYLCVSFIISLFGVFPPHP
jgi:microcystin-dependent protein